METYQKILLGTGGLVGLLAVLKTVSAKAGKARIVVEKSSSPTNIGAGGHVTHIINIRNIGAQSAMSLSAYDTIPRGFVMSGEGIKGSGGDSDCVVTVPYPGVAYFEITGDLGPGQTCYFSYEIFTPLDASGLYKDLIAVNGINIDGSAIPTAIDKSYVMVTR